MLKRRDSKALLNSEWPGKASLKRWDLNWVLKGRSQSCKDQDQGGWPVQVKGPASAKTLRWEHACLSGGAEKRLVCLGYSGQGQEKLEIKLSRQPGGAHTGLRRQWWGLQLLFHTGWKAMCVSEQTDKAFSLTESRESFIPRSAQKHIQPHFKSLGNLWCVNKLNVGTSLEVQWLRLCTSIAGDSGLIPGQETKIPHAVWCGQNKTKQKLNVHGSWYLPLEFLKIKHFIKKKL